ncbi:hypothetical protein WJX81_001693 [Elliptochloris bilobata]|uniref:Major facilitator superfamily (MFS) profile domain-containing protein n=1 Tax=Elliptochloris bilobata TaxID=381761 RepID=A0AAW1SHZ3_9CHLO
MDKGHDGVKPFREPGKYAASSMEAGELAGAPGDEKVDPRTVVRKTLGSIIPWMFFVVIWTYLDRSNLAFSALPFKKYLGLSNADYGLGAGIFFIGYCVSMLPSNLFILWLGAPTWLAIIICVWGVVGAATAAVKNHWEFYLVRFLLGVAEGGTFPGTFYHSSLFFSTHELTYGYSAVSSATALSQVIGALVAAAIFQMDGLSGLPGWMWLFILEGAATVIFGLALRVFLAPTPGQAWFLKPAERRWLQKRQDDNHEAAMRRTHGANSSMIQGLTNWRLWYLGVMWFLVECSIYGVLFWAPLLIDAMLQGQFSGVHSAKPAPDLSAKETSWNTTKNALISCAVYIPVAITMISIAWSSKNRKERNLHGGIPVLISGVAFLVMPVAIERGGVIAGIIVLIIAAAGAWSLFGPIWSWPATFLFGEARATGIAAFNTLGALGGFTGPYIIGALSNSGSFTRPMYVLGCFNIVAAAMILTFRAPDHVGDLDTAEEEGGAGNLAIKAPAAARTPAAAPPSSGAVHVNGSGAVSRDS